MGGRPGSGRRGRAQSAPTRHRDGRPSSRPLSAAKNALFLVSFPGRYRRGLYINLLHVYPINPPLNPHRLGGFRGVSTRQQAKAWPEMPIGAQKKAAWRAQFPFTGDGLPGRAPCAPLVPTDWYVRACEILAKSWPVFRHRMRPMLRS